MKLFVSEYVCGGGWRGGERPHSLAREGQAMLLAVLRDAIDAGCMAMTTWDRTLGEMPNAHDWGIEVRTVRGPDEERAAFRQLCQQAEAVCVIAPEFDDELQDRVEFANTLCSNVLNCSGESIKLCGDKWEFFLHCQQHRLPTILSCRWNSQDLERFPWPRVLKLRQGAGSQQMRLVGSESEWAAALAGYDVSACSSEPIIQPYRIGDAISVGAMVGPRGLIELFPVADQFIDPNAGFAYSGGRIPSRWNTAAVRDLALRVIRSISGLSGYVGIDMLVPAELPDEPLVVEVNPRLTTSYIGYRRNCPQNLVARMIGQSSEPLRWGSQPMTFQCLGDES